MAKNKVNKAKAIREALDANPDLGPKELSELLNKDGIKVTAVYVSMIKSKAKKDGPQTQPKTQPQATPNGSVSLDDLKAAKLFFDTVGQVKAKKTLDEYISLTGRDYLLTN